MLRVVSTRYTLSARCGAQTEKHKTSQRAPLALRSQRAARPELVCARLGRMQSGLALRWAAWVVIGGARKDDCGLLFQL